MNRFGVRVVEGEERFLHFARVLTSARIRQSVCSPLLCSRRGDGRGCTSCAVKVSKCLQVMIFHCNFTCALKQPSARIDEGSEYSADARTKEKNREKHLCCSCALCSPLLLQWCPKTASVFSLIQSCNCCFGMRPSTPATTPSPTRPPCR